MDREAGDIDPRQPCPNAADNANLTSRGGAGGRRVPRLVPDRDGPARDDESEGQPEPDSPFAADGGLVGHGGLHFDAAVSAAPPEGVSEEAAAQS